MDKIFNIGQLREAIKDLSDKDQVCIQTVEFKSGDEIDLVPIFIEIIEGVRLKEGGVVKEVRFCYSDY